MTSLPVQRWLRAVSTKPMTVGTAKSRFCGNATICCRAGRLSPSGWKKGCTRKPAEASMATRPCVSSDSRHL
eukprot:scaffold70542_cov63-Phaeocystis_antarctica.AAC.1